ncbi:MAG TPA: hypothetical protein VNI02_08580 [Blastocatellia bacterium]|jgi:hypothetical protein|nr:hypothetical protein [Blastocatellia bacterium]
MKDVMNKDARAGERGAISIKSLFMLTALAASVFLVIKFAPVYIEQRKLMHDVEELARIAAVRNWKEDKIAPEVNKIRGDYDLPDGSLNVVKHERDVRITVGYSRAIDLLVTTYDWRVDRTIIGKEL